MALDLSILKKMDFERPPVGVKYLNEKPKGLKKLDGVMEICAMLVEAQQGEAFYITKDNISCIGTMLLGMVPAEPEFESGKVGPRLGAYKDVRANQRIYQYIPRLARDSVQYVAFAPMEKLNFDPDLLIVLADSTQTELFIRAKAYTTGEMWTARGTPVVGCVWLYIYPWVSGEMNIGITGVGFGMRSRRLFPEGKFLITIPWDKLPGIIQNLEEMEWVPESFTLGPEGHKAKVKRIVEEIRRESEEAE
jgi:uncharacterized protein (DUF169 family)